MSVAFKRIMENIKGLSPGERALIAHCLISSLESEPNEDVDGGWAALAESRLSELESGAVQGISWEEIKNKVKD